MRSADSRFSRISIKLIQVISFLKMKSLAWSCWYREGPSVTNITSIRQEQSQKVWRDSHKNCRSLHLWMSNLATLWRYRKHRRAAISYCFHRHAPWMLKADLTSFSLNWFVWFSWPGGGTAAEVTGCLLQPFSMHQKCSQEMLDDSY